MDTTPVWAIYRNNPDAIAEGRGKFIGIFRNSLKEVSEKLAVNYGVGEYIAVPQGSHSKSDGVPPIRFITVLRSEVEVQVQ